MANITAVSYFAVAVLNLLMLKAMAKRYKYRVFAWLMDYDTLKECWQPISPFFVTHKEAKKYKYVAHRDFPSATISRIDQIELLPIIIQQ